MKEANNNIKDLFVEVYAHYPDALNSTTISDKLEIALSEYFECDKCICMIKTAPFGEEEMIIIDLVASCGVDIQLIKEIASKVLGVKLINVKVNMLDN